MKKVLIGAIVYFALSRLLFCQTFTRSFDTPNPLSEWSGDTESWTVVNSSAVAGGAENSMTLKLNVAAGAGQKSLSIQNTLDWGEEQSWTFWLGRGAQEYTSQNAVYVWLWADQPNLNAPNINGYRINIGDSEADNIKLEKVVNGQGSTFSVGEEYIPSGITNFGMGLRVTRNSNSIWTIYATAEPTTDGGVKATSPLSESNVNNYVNTITYFGHDDTFKFRGSGYMGITAIHTLGEVARRAVEFDNFEFRNSLTYNEYAWVGSVNNQFEVPENWNPSRYSKSLTDILKFNNTSTVEGITDEWISSIQILNNSNVTFKNSIPSSFYLVGGLNPAIDIKESAHLKVLSDVDFAFNIEAGAKADIYGTMELSKESTTIVNHRLSASQEESIKVFGSLIQNCSGSLFGTSTITKNIIAFEPGSSFISMDGASPFGIPQPGSKVVFKTGSNYVHRQNSQLSSSGRRYSNIEIDGSTVTLITAGDQLLNCDDLTITNSNFLINNSSSNFQIEVKGNLNVSSSSIFQLLPTGTGKAMLELSGDGKSITGADKLTVGKNVTLKVSNNIALNNDLLISGNLHLASGTFNLNSHQLSFADNATIQKVNGNLSAPPLPNLNLNYIYGDGTTTNLETGIELMPEANSLTMKTIEGLHLNSSVLIKQSLSFENGKIFSDVLNYITVRSAASISNVADNRYNEGPIALETSSTQEVSFPIGINGKVRPIGIIPSSSNPSVFRASYLHSSYNSNQHSTDLEEVSKKEWWSLERLDGNARAKVKLTWNSESGINEKNLPDLRVARFNGMEWQNEGAEFIGAPSILSNELDEFGPFTFAGTDKDIFPVVFYSFDAEPKQGFSILKWQTAAEWNNLGFALEKSGDAVYFEEIAFIEPSKNNSEIKTYQYLDNSFFESAYYRVKQVDYNGSSLYSKIIYLEAKPSEQFFVKPNPSKGKITLVADGTFKDVYEISVHSIEGLKLADLKGDLLSIEQTLNDLFGKCPDGVYLITIKYGENLKSLKFFKQ